MKISPQKALTLFELLITVVVISILLLIGFASFDNIINAHNLQSATEQLALAVKKTKYYAKSHGEITKFNFTESNSYRIGTDNKILTNSKNFDATSGILPGKVKFLSNSCSVMNFYIDGSLVDGFKNTLDNDCRIVLGYTGGTNKTLVIKPENGNIVYE